MSKTGWEIFFEDNIEDIQRCLDRIGVRCHKPGVYLVPQPSRVFRFMECCPYETLKVVIVGQEPYATLDAEKCAYANGIAFSTDKGMTPSLTVIREWLWQHDTRYRGWNIDTSLISWCNQGVLLMNTSLTAECNDKNVPAISHKITWEAIIRSLLGYCSRNGRVVFVLMGNVALEYEDSIAKGCSIIKVEHPASIARKGKVACGSEPFTRINDQLMKHGVSPIAWTSVFH